MSVVETESLLTTALATPAPTGIRLLRAPLSEPPYDDQRPGGQPLALRPASWTRTRPLRLVPPLSDEPDPRTPATDLPSAQVFAHALVQRLLEVLAGVRPLAQLQRDSSLEVYDGLQLLLAARPRPQGARPDRRDVRSVHVQQADGVAEVNATVRRNGRYSAFALRLEGIGGRWRCTELVGV
ncbi:MAG: Rv3235 family protein [Mycobacteriales bacterium]